MLKLRRYYHKHSQCSLCMFFMHRAEHSFVQYSVSMWTQQNTSFLLYCHLYYCCVVVWWRRRRTTIKPLATLPADFVVWVCNECRRRQLLCSRRSLHFSFVVQCLQRLLSIFIVDFLLLHFFSCSVWFVRMFGVFQIFFYSFNKKFIVF